MAKASAPVFITCAKASHSAAIMELVCSANSLAALRTTVDNGADCVHIQYGAGGNPAGLHFDDATLARGIRYAHDNGCKAILELESHTGIPTWGRWRDTIDHAVQCGIDAIVLSDSALLLYSAAQYPELPLHYNIPNSHLNYKTIDLFRKQFGIARIILPRVLSIAQIAQISTHTSVELQVFGRGNLVPKDDLFKTALRTSFKSEATANFPMGSGTAVELRTAPVEHCANSLNAANDMCFAFDKLSSLETLKLLPQLIILGVKAIRIEGPSDNSHAHLAQVTRVWREAMNDCMASIDHFTIRSSWIADLDNHAIEPSQM